MGLFCVSTEKTIKAQLDCAKGNIELFEQDKCSVRSDYLLGFAITQLENVLDMLKEQKNASMDTNIQSTSSTESTDN